MDYRIQRIARVARQLEIAFRILKSCLKLIDDLKKTVYVFRYLLLKGQNGV